MHLLFEFYRSRSFLYVLSAYASGPETRPKISVERFPFHAVCQLAGCWTAERSHLSPHSSCLVKNARQAPVGETGKTAVSERNKSECLHRNIPPPPPLPFAPLRRVGIKFLPRTDSFCGTIKSERVAREREWESERVREWESERDWMRRRLFRFMPRRFR